MITFIVDNGLYYDAHGIVFLNVPEEWAHDLDNVETAIGIVVSPNGFVVGRAENVVWRHAPHWVPGVPDEACSQVFWDFVTPCALIPHPDETLPRLERAEATKKLPKDFLRRLLAVWPEDVACRDLIEELVK